MVNRKSRAKLWARVGSRAAGPTYHYRHSANSAAGHRVAIPKRLAISFVQSIDYGGASTWRGGCVVMSE